jgi:hypothetical protein
MGSPCGLDDCSKCEVCKYDLPLDAIFKHNIDNKMKNFGIVPMAGNPSTAQLIIPKSETKPFCPEGPVQLHLPFKDDKKNSYCNNCEFLIKIDRPGQQTCNCKCAAEKSIPGGKILKLKVYPEEKIKKPFWCPIIKSEITGNGSFVCKKENTSAMSDSQLDAWTKSKEERIKKEKWLSLPGITSWADIKMGRTYHMPPMLKKGRMDLYIVTKYCDSLMAYKKGTNERVWLYKQDEEFKYLSEIS